MYSVWICPVLPCRHAQSMHTIIIPNTIPLSPACPRKQCFLLLDTKHIFFKFWSVLSTISSLFCFDRLFPQHLQNIIKNLECTFFAVKNSYDTCDGGKIVSVLPVGGGWGEILIYHTASLTSNSSADLICKCCVQYICKTYFSINIYNTKFLFNKNSIIPFII